MQAVPPPPGSPQPKVDFSVIGDGFKILFANWKDFAAAGSVLFAALIPLGILVFVTMLATERQPESTALLTTMILFAVVGIFAVAIQGCLAIGITNYTLNLARNGHASLSDMWIGFKNPLPNTGAFFIVTAITLIGVCACIVGTYIVAGLLMFVWAVMVDRKLGPMEAVRESWSILKDEWLMATVFFFVVNLIASIGIYACYVGFVLTYPLTFVYPALLYNRYVGFAPTDSHSPYPRGTEQPRG